MFGKIIYKTKQKPQIMDQEQLFKHARKLMGKKQFDKALKPLLDINEIGVSKDVLETKYILLSTCYHHLADYPESLNWANKTSLINKSNIFASASKCQAYQKMNQYEKAYDELYSFLKTDDSILPKVILLEFLKQISSGEITDTSFVEKINLLAEENEISLDM